MKNLFYSLLIFPLSLFGQNYSLDFSYGNYGRIPTSETLSNFESFTMEFWYYHTSVSNDDEHIVGTEYFGGNRYVMGSHNGRLWPRISDGNNGIGPVEYYSGSITNQYLANTWTHLAMSYNGEVLSFFINGELIDSEEGQIASFGPINEYLVINRHTWDTGSSSRLTGQIDELRISNTARYSNNFIPQTEEFISDEFTAGLWHFNNDFNDYSGNGNHGTHVGTSYSENTPILIIGCADPLAYNYNPEATEDDGSCEYFILGCTDVESFNYDEDATQDDGSCEYKSSELMYSGCDDPEANNYNPNATINDSTCFYDHQLLEQFDMTFASNFNYESIQLEEGKDYKIVISGSYGVAWNNGKDAAYYFQCCDWSSDEISISNEIWLDGTSYRPITNHYKEHHEYVYSITGSNQPLVFEFSDVAYGDNFGSLNIEIWNSNSANNDSSSTTSNQTINVPNDYSTIQEAIDASSDGDTIMVSPGIFYENDITFNGKEIVLLSSEGLENTIIDGSDNGRIFDITQGESFDTQIIGFTIQNGNHSTGSAIRIINDSYLTVKNCIIQNNSAPGIWTRAAVTIGQEYNNATRTPAGAKFISTSFINNSGYYGAAVFNEESGEQSSEFIECIFDSNNGFHGAAIHGTRNSIIRNCIFIDNYSSGPSNAIIQNEGGNPEIINSIFYNNQSYVLARNSSLPTQIINCVSTNNHGFINLSETDVNLIQVSYSNIEGGYEGEGNIDIDPLFVNAEIDDFSLQEGSPCIDAGNPDSPLDPDSTIADMGAIYFHQNNLEDTIESDGCTDALAFNYNENATQDDGSCYPVIEGCMNSIAENYITPIENVQIDVNTEDGSCLFSAQVYDDITTTNSNLEEELSVFETVDEEQGYSMSFDGLWDYVQTDNISQFYIQEYQSYTIECWIKTNDELAVFLTNRSLTTNSSPFYYLGFGKTPSNLMEGINTSWRYDNSGSYNSTNFYEEEDITDGNWHHFAFVRDVNVEVINIFKDGILINQFTDNHIGSNISPSDGNLQIGGWAGPGWNGPGGREVEFLNGLIDDVRISNTVRYHNNFIPKINFESDENTIAYYDFNQGSGDTVNDLSGNGNYGIVYGDAHFVQDSPSIYSGCTDENALNYDSSALCENGSCVYGDDILSNLETENSNLEEELSVFETVEEVQDFSMSFDGVNNSVIIQPSSLLDASVTNELTLSSWVKINDTTSLESILRYYPDNLNNPDSGEPNMQYSMSIDNGKIYFIAGAGNININQFEQGYSNQGTSTLSINQWLYITITYDQEYIKFYINGILDYERSIDANFDNKNGGQLFIGSDGIFEQWKLNGGIEDTEIWNKSLTQEQIQSYMSCSPTGEEEGLVGYWNFNEGSGDTVYDMSGNGNHGVIYGGAEFSEDVPESYNGCTDVNALNFDESALCDNGSCVYGDDVLSNLEESFNQTVSGLNNDLDSTNSTLN